MLQKVKFLQKNRDSFWRRPCRPPQPTPEGSYVDLLSFMLRSVAQLLLTMILERFFAPIRPLPAIPPDSRGRLVQKGDGEMCKIFKKHDRRVFEDISATTWSLELIFRRVADYVGLLRFSSKNPVRTFVAVVRTM